MYTDDIIDYLNNKYNQDLDIISLNDKKISDSEELYKDDETNLLLSTYIVNKDLDAIIDLINKETDIEVLLEAITRLNTLDYVNDSLKDAIYNKYQELLKTCDQDLLLDVFEEILGYSFATPLNGDTYYLLDLYDRMILNSFKDQDYTKFKAKAIKELKKAKLSKEVNAYLDKIIKTL